MVTDVVGTCTQALEGSLCISCIPSGHMPCRPVPVLHLYRFINKLDHILVIHDTFLFVQILESLQLREGVGISTLYLCTLITSHHS